MRQLQHSFNNAAQPLFASHMHKICNSIVSSPRNINSHWLFNLFRLFHLSIPNTCPSDNATTQRKKTTTSKQRCNSKRSNAQTINPEQQQQQQQQPQPQKPSKSSSSSLSSPPLFGKSEESHLQFVEYAAEQLGVKKVPDDWYKLSAKDLSMVSGGTRLLNVFYNGSLFKLLSTLYPQHEWLPWRFHVVPRRFWSSEANRKRFIEWAGRQLGVQKLDDWYNITYEQVADLGGSSLLERYYNNSLINALSALYPEHDWAPWLFQVVPSGFWKNPANHKRFFEWAAKMLGVEHLDGWYNVSRDQVRKMGGAGLLDNYYDNSLVLALTQIYPEHNWKPWLFSSMKAPQGFWGNQLNQLKFLEWAAAQLGVKSLDDWYRVSNAELNALGGSRMLKYYYGGSMFHLLRTLYPEHQWLPWKFKSVPPSLWKDEATQRAFFSWAAAQLGIYQLNDWYKCSREDIVRLGGRTLLDTCYDGTLVGALSRLYPRHEWLPWRFSSGVPRGFWSDMRNQRRFFDWVARVLKIESSKDWHEKASCEEIGRLGGSGLLSHYYGNSLAQALEAIYPHMKEECRTRAAEKEESSNHHNPPQS